MATTSLFLSTPLIASRHGTVAQVTEMSMSATQQVSAKPVTSELLERSWTAFEGLLERVALPALRMSLGLVFVWFGALKVMGTSPVAGLVSATVPWANPGMVVPTLGTVEIVLGLALLAGQPRRLALLAVAAHLTGTFLTFIQAPSLVISGGNPLLLTESGEFVLKNLVLICAALALLSQTSRRQPAKPGRWLPGRLSRIMHGSPTVGPTQATLTS